MAGSSSDKVEVIFCQFNSAGRQIMREYRHCAISTLMATIFSYSIIKPDDCVRMTVDIAYPMRGIET